MRDLSVVCDAVAPRFPSCGIGGRHARRQASFVDGPSSLHVVFLTVPGEKALMGSSASRARRGRSISNNMCTSVLLRGAAEAPRWIESAYCPAGEYSARRLVKLRACTTAAPVPQGTALAGSAPKRLSAQFWIIRFYIRFALHGQEQLRLPPGNPIRAVVSHFPRAHDGIAGAEKADPRRHRSGL